MNIHAKLAQYWTGNKLCNDSPNSFLREFTEVHKIS